MTKIISILISLCIILNACNKKNSESDSPTPNPLITREDPSNKRDSKLGSPIMGGGGGGKPSNKRKSKLSSPISSTINIENNAETEQPQKNLETNKNYKYVEYAKTSVKYTITGTGVITGEQIIKYGIKTKQLWATGIGVGIEAMSAITGSITYYDQKHKTNNSWATVTSTICMVAGVVTILYIIW